MFFLFLFLGKKKTTPQYESFNKNSSFMCFNSIKIPQNCSLKSLYRQSVKFPASGKSVACSLFLFYVEMTWNAMLEPVFSLS